VHADAHLPLSQTSPAAHVFPQPPQFFGSVFVFAQNGFSPAQRVKPPPQIVSHFPALHTLDAEHTFPHVPQLRLSVCVSTHDPKHAALPVGHVASHLPATQTCAPMQAVPQRPQ
jgi:hypothetical protein